MAKEEKSTKKGKKSVLLDIQYQIRVAGPGAQYPKTYEYSAETAMDAALANISDPYKRELRLLKFLAKEFKKQAQTQKKKLLSKRKKAAGKSAK